MLLVIVKNVNYFFVIKPLFARLLLMYLVMRLKQPDLDRFEIHHNKLVPVGRRQGLCELYSYLLMPVLFYCNIPHYTCLEFFSYGAMVSLTNPSMLPSSFTRLDFGKMYSE